MASKLKDTVATVRSVARTFQAVIDMADTLDQVGDLDQAALDAQKRLDNLNKDIAKKNDELAGVQKKIDAAQEELEDANDNALGAVAKANKEANDILEKANADANDIVNKANAKATSINKKVDAAQDKLDSIVADTASKQAELDTLNENISKTKAQLRALAG